LRAFVDGPDRSIHAAQYLESALNRAFPDDDAANEDVQDLVLALASYQPGGGEYLYSQESILPLAKFVLSLLEGLS